MLTQFALSNRALFVAIMLMSVLMGPISFFSHPAREDPEIVIRNAKVLAQYPGMSAERIEDLITRKLEEKVREIPEVKDIVSTSSTGESLLSIELQDEVTETEPVWTELRNKIDDVLPDLPSGTVGPLVFDDQGNVAMATVALRGDGFENWELREIAKEFRRIVYAEVPGVRKVELFGVRDQRVYVEFDNIRLSQLGLEANTIVDAIAEQNVILPGGRVEADGTTITVEPTGDFGGVDDLEALSIQVTGDDNQLTTIYLRDIATIRLGYAEPPETPAFFNGEEAVVISVSMIDQFNSQLFSGTLTAVAEQFENEMPWGITMDFITFQQTEIDGAVYSVLNNLLQTCAVVLVVVVAFLGLRTGLIVGAMVPLVMLMSTLIMRQQGIELERMSLASLIISLGLLVDNGIVVAEDIQGRLQRGQDRIKAAIEAGRDLALPLLTASLTTIFAFMPLMLAPGGAGEYTRSISLVIAISLIVSWIVALTLLILFCVWFMKPGPVKEQTYDQWYYRGYRGLIGWAVRFRLLVLPAAVAFLALGVWMMNFVDKTFFPASERTQLQVIVELPVGANAYATEATVARLTDWLLDEDANPTVTGVASYIASGGPRFYLGLSPIDGFPNLAYMLVNVAASDAVIPLRDQVRRYALTEIPEARVTPKEMSMGPSEVGLIEYRLVGQDASVLNDAAQKIMAKMRGAPQATSIKSDWENPTVSLSVVVDQNAARRAGVTSQDIANALNSQLAGATVTDYRVGDISIPVVIRATGDQRTNIDRVRTLNIAVAGSSPVPLLQVARFEGDPGYSRIKRRNLQRVMTVSGKSSELTAGQFDQFLSETLAEVEAGFPAGYRIEKGGELEGSAEAQENLAANMPLAFSLIILILVWQFNSFRNPLIILLTIPLVITGVSASLMIFPGASLSFMGILGLLALSGIIINNAIVLIDRINLDLAEGATRREAITEAAVKRLRPIIMTTCTTALGLAPIILARDVLFYDLAVVIAGGLIVGTILTLVVVPCLYAVIWGRLDEAPMALGTPQPEAVRS